MTTIQQALDDATANLRMHDTARLDAEVLLAHVMDQSRTFLHTWPEKHIDAASLSRFHGLVARRAQGEPVAYLVGYQEFWSLTLQVTPATLIPRAETELLVEQSLAHIPMDTVWQIADLGAGSGAIALALAHERPACRITAVERDSHAVSVAAENARRLGINNVGFIHGEWFTPLAAKQFHLIASNPPYVAAADPHLQLGDVRFEPETALIAGERGLDDLHYIISVAPDYLRPGGWLCLEHGYDQAKEVADRLRAAGFGSLSQYHDLNGHVRVSCAQRPGGEN